MSPQARSSVTAGHAAPQARRQDVMSQQDGARDRVPRGEALCGEPVVARYCFLVQIIRGVPYAFLPPQQPHVATLRRSLGCCYRVATRMRALISSAPFKSPPFIRPNRFLCPFFLLPLLCWLHCLHLPRAGRNSCPLCRCPHAPKILQQLCQHCSYRTALLRFPRAPRYRCVGLPTIWLQSSSARTTPCSATTSLTATRPCTTK
jgi:hypothetical protein